MSFSSRTSFMELACLENTLIIPAGHITINGKNGNEEIMSYFKMSKQFSDTDEGKIVCALI
jgi:hypothetical protein